MERRRGRERRGGLFAERIWQDGSVFDLALAVGSKAVAVTAGTAAVATPLPNRSGEQYRTGLDMMRGLWGVIPGQLQVGADTHQHGRPFSREESF